MRLRPAGEANLSDWNGFYEELRAESPRASAILAAAYLDAWLRFLLECALLDDRKAADRLLGSEQDPDRPLSSFGARISAAYCLGLISKQESEDLRLVSRVRNRFAHRAHGYSFEDPEIVGWCDSLQIPTQLSSSIKDRTTGHRGSFLLGVILLTAALQSRAKAAQQRRPAHVDDFNAVAYVAALAKAAGLTSAST